MVLGKDRFSGVDIRVRVKGGGKIAQIYAIRQAISKSLVAYYQKCLTKNSFEMLKKFEFEILFFSFSFFFRRRRGK